MDLADRELLHYQEVLVTQATPRIPFLQNDWSRSHRLGLPSGQADQVDPEDRVLQEYPLILGNPCHPLCRCSLALPWGLVVRLVLVNLEVLVCLGILANLQDL